MTLGEMKERFEKECNISPLIIIEPYWDWFNSICQEAVDEAKIRLTKDDKFLEEQQSYVNQKVDYNITAFQKTEIPALIDLAHDSFEAGYQCAINRLSLPD